MTTKLKLYNGALRKLAVTPLDSLTEDVKARYVLDECYDEIIGQCLEAGWWDFAMRAARAEYDSSLSHAFGYRNGFDKPSDWVRTYIISLDEYFNTPMLDYEDRNGRWLCDHEEIYVKWISNGSNYGLDLARWPATFTQYVQFALAEECAEPITQSSSKMEEMMKMKVRTLHSAKNIDALNDPVTRFQPKGRLVSSRGSRSSEGRYKAG